MHAVSPICTYTDMKTQVYLENTLYSKNAGFVCQWFALRISRNTSAEVEIKLVFYSNNSSYWDIFRYIPHSEHRTWSLVALLTWSLRNLSNLNFLSEGGFQDGGMQLFNICVFGRTCGNVPDVEDVFFSCAMQGRNWAYFKLRGQWFLFFFFFFF